MSTSNLQITINFYTPEYLVANPNIAIDADGSLDEAKNHLRHGVPLVEAAVLHALHNLLVDKEEYIASIRVAGFSGQYLYDGAIVLSQDRDFKQLQIKS